MQPSVLVIQTFYPEFLKDIYSAEPGLADQDFESQCARLFSSAFSTSDAYSQGLAALGCRTWEIICNADAAQRRWASDRGLSPTGNIHDQRRAVVAAQIEEFRPDVVYVFEWCPLGDPFLAEMRDRVGLVVGEIASPLPKDRTFRGFDLMISSWPPIVDSFREEGIDAEHVRLGFDRRVLDRLPPRETRYDVTFVGGFAESHPDRIAWLEQLLGDVDIDVFCYGIERTREDSPIRKHFRGQAWGLEMYRALQQSKITLNRHARIDVRGTVQSDWCNNMRMYEATGVGTCLLTEWRPHLADLFEPDREVATYRDTAECAAKIRYYLDHPEERESIARAGQRRTLRDHLYTDRMAELLGHFERRLASKGTFRSRSVVPTAL